MSLLRERRGDDAISELTSRELDVLRLVTAGEPNRQIAAELVISERTARTHVSRILRKLRLSSLTQAALWAVREGLVETEREPHQLEAEKVRSSTTGLLGLAPGARLADRNTIATDSANSRRATNRRTRSETPRPAAARHPRDGAADAPRRQQTTAL
jgi:DNA-binding CsgD family transcriptional regulator